VFFFFYEFSLYLTQFFRCFVDFILGWSCFVFFCFFCMGLGGWCIVVGGSATKADCLSQLIAPVMRIGLQLLLGSRLGIGYHQRHPTHTLIYTYTHKSIDNPFHSNVASYHEITTNPTKSPQIKGISRNRSQKPKAKSQKPKSQIKTAHRPRQHIRRPRYPLP